MPGRTYGELDPSLRWSCGYMEHATDPACMTPARWHGILPELGDRAMSSCDKHTDVMRLSAGYVHEMGTACFLPGSMFDSDENECWMPHEAFSQHEAAAATPCA
jgi:hypothetical protein